MRRIFAAATGATLVLIGSLASAQDKPNVVYILVDNWGWGDIGVQGSTIPTPRIDAFAAQILAELPATMTEYPNIRPGRDFSGYE